MHGDVKPNLTFFPFKDDELERYFNELTEQKSLIVKLLAEEDQVDLPVFTYNNGLVLKKYCEQYGYPNVTKDGQLMYNNTFFKTEKEARKAAIKDAKSTWQANLFMLKRSVMDTLETMGMCLESLYFLIRAVFLNHLIQYKNMKNHLLTILFCGLVHMTFAQNIPSQYFIDTLNVFETDSVIIGEGRRIIMGNSSSYKGYVIVDFFYDCTPWENYSCWEQVISDKSLGLSICVHEWVYAKYKDVNPQTGTTTMVYCPCGCPQYENEARICRKCKRHEKRTHSWGFTYEPHESEYKKLLKEIEKN